MARHAAGAMGHSAGDEHACVAVAVRSVLQRVQLHAVVLRRRADPWTGDADWARFSVILVNIWVGAPFFMIMYLAALKSVPDQLYEAAAIDGANWWQRIWYVTLPMMRNIIAITTLFSLIVTFANFDIVRILTAGGPLDHAHLRDMGVPVGIEGATSAGRRLAVHGADPGGRSDLHPARHQQTRE